MSRHRQQEKKNDKMEEDPRPLMYQVVTPLK